MPRTMLPRNKARTHSYTPSLSDTASDRPFYFPLHAMGGCGRTIAVMSFLSSYRGKLLILFLCVLLMSALAINSGSLWDDEGYRSFFALYNDFDNMLAYSGRDKQFAFVFYEWLWLAVFPHTEIGMRCMNIPFLLMGCAYLARMLHNRGMSPMWAAVLVLHPMVWYYTNEVSPYIIMLSASLGLCFHTFFARKPESWGNIAGVNACFLLGYACHFIFGFAYFIVMAGVLLRLCRREPVAWGRYLLVFAAFCLCYLPLTWWYWVHMEDGQNYGWGHPGIANIAYVVYSFLGMQGMGLSRLDIRAGEWAHLTPAMLVVLSVFVVTAGALLLLNIRVLFALLRQRWVAALGICAAVFYAGAYLKYFQFWERHVVMLLVLPLVLIPLLGHAIVAAAPSWHRRVSLILLSVAGCCWVISALNLAFNDYYRKDDFKGVVSYLREQGCSESSTPILAQGNRFVYFYYESLFPYQMPQERMLQGFGIERGKLILVNQVPPQAQIALIAAAVRAYGSADLVLCRRDTSFAGGNPDAAEELFRSKGYGVERKADFNMFRLIRLRSPRRMSVFE